MSLMGLKMQIADVLKMKTDYEQRISSMLDDFDALTGCYIESIDLTKCETTNIGDDLHRFVYIINLRVAL